jgi:hypothetical protein
MPAETSFAIHHLILLLDFHPLQMLPVLSRPRLSAQAELTTHVLLYVHRFSTLQMILERGCSPHFSQRLLQLIKVSASQDVKMVVAGSQAAHV